MNNSKIKTIFILSAIFIVIFLIFSCGVSNLVFQKEIKKYQENAPQIIDQRATLIINEGEGTPKTLKLGVQEGSTAFDLLKRASEKLNISLRTKTYDIGILIEAIGDKENGQDGKYWMYYINGEMPSVAADKKEIKVGDEVEFKFEKSPF